jgi:Flp pilus assembly protein TadD
MSELRGRWLTSHEADRHEDNVEFLELAIDAHPDIAELWLLLATSLFGAGRNDDASEAVAEGLTRAPEDPVLLHRAASLSFYLGDVTRARTCADAAARLAPRKFIFKDELRELRGNIAAREKHEEAERTILLAFQHGRHVVGTGEALARLYAETGRTYAAYEVVAEALRHRPDDARLLQLRTELAADVPADVRAELEGP